MCKDSYHLQTQKVCYKTTCSLSLQCLLLRLSYFLRITLFLSEKKAFSYILQWHLIFDYDKRILWNSLEMLLTCSILSPFVDINTIYFTINKVEIMLIFFQLSTKQFLGLPGSICRPYTVYLCLSIVFLYVSSFWFLSGYLPGSHIISKC